MASYVNTDITKTALIMAAGELFAEHGIDAVSVRDIARKAGANIGVIHYHFGGKDGLIDAVMAFAGELWKNDPFGTYLAEHRHLLITVEQKNTVIFEMIKMFFDLLYCPQKPVWCCKLLFQILQRDLAISEKVFAEIGAPLFDAFMQLYHLVSGDEDPENAYLWSSAIIAPAVVHAINPLPIGRSSPEDAFFDCFLNKLREFCCRQACNSIALLPTVKL